MLDSLGETTLEHKASPRDAERAVRVCATSVARGLRNTGLFSRPTPQSQTEPSADATDATVVEIAARHAYRAKVLPFFLAGLEIPSTMDRGTIDALGEDFQRLTFEANTGILEHALNAMAALDAAGLVAVVMKGPTQQQQLHGTYFARPSGDLDIITSSRDYRDAMRVLGGIGFRPLGRARSAWWDHFLGEHHLANASARWGTIDLHHRLQQPGSPQVRHTADVIAAAESMPFRGRSLRVVARRHVPMISALNLVKGLYGRDTGGAAHACDLVVSLRFGEPNRVAAFLDRAGHFGVRGTAILALKIVASSFAMPVAPVEAEIQAMLPEITDDQLRAMVFAPATLDAWPKRRAILRAACGGPMRFAREAAWAGLSEAVLRLESPAQST